MSPEEILDALTLKGFIKQKDLAVIIGTSPNSVGRALKKKGIERTPFGYSVTKVIQAFDLQPFINNLISRTK